MATSVTALNDSSVENEPDKPRRIDEAGYWCLFVLACLLPFELIQGVDLLWGALSLSNLKVVIYVLLGLAVASLNVPFREFARNLIHKRLNPENYFYKRRKPFALFVALLAACLISSLLAPEKGEGLKSSWQLSWGMLIWLATPLWFAGDTARKINRLAVALVSAAVICSLVGFGEFVFGMDFANSLSGWFKRKPTVAGPFLRLSGTFDYANVTAMYLELILPFAILGLAGAIGRKRWERALLWLGAVGILGGALLLTFSRGALLGAGIGFVAMLLGGRGWLLRPAGKSWKWTFGLSAVAGLAVTGIILVLSPLFMLRFTTQSDQDWYKADYQGEPPAVLNVCQRLTIPVVLRNTSPLTWYATGSTPYNLSYHWLYPSGEMAVFEGIRNQLPANLPPGASQTVEVHLRAPDNPGQYLLVWDMVEENVTWFSLKSAVYTRYPVQVNDLSAADRTASCGLSPQEAEIQTHPAPKELPKVLIQPNRGVLWAAAVQMLLQRPLFGIGPGGFRLSYGYYMKPPITDWDNRVMANSLPLEMFANLGLVGGGLFFAFLLVACWPIVGMLWRGKVAYGWQIIVAGGLAAFFGHGLLDYFLHSHAILVLFWLLVGLAAIPGQVERKEDASRN